MIYFTSDTHFSHRNIIDYCKRGFKTCEEMNQFIINRWNEKVPKNATVYHLGDFGLAPSKELANIRKQLNGRIILVEGNHDGCISKTRWFHEIKIDEYVTELEIPSFYLRHHPPIEKRSYTTLCGHVHNAWHLNQELLAINVGVDVNNFYPLDYLDIIALSNDLMKLEDC